MLQYMQFFVPQLHFQIKLAFMLKSTNFLSYAYIFRKMKHIFFFLEKAHFFSEICTFFCVLVCISNFPDIWFRFSKMYILIVPAKILQNMYIFGICMTCGWLGNSDLGNRNVVINAPKHASFGPMIPFSNKISFHH